MRAHIIATLLAILSSVQLARSYWIAPSCDDMGLTQQVEGAVNEAMNVAYYANWRMQQQYPPIDEVGGSGDIVEELLGPDANARQRFIGQSNMF